MTYIPDLLTPAPGLGDHCADLFDEQLAAIEATSQEDLEHQVIAGIEDNWGTLAPVAVRRAAESGRMQRRLASGLARFWREALTDLWPAVRSVIDQDLAHRGTTLVARGLGRVLNTAHPRIAWIPGAITLDKVWTGKIDLTGRELVLAPMVLIQPDVLVQGPADAVLYLPAQRVGTASSRTGKNLGAVLGDTRALLLAELHEARSTTELAKRLGYTAGTISYHLGAMHRVGLVTKVRDRRYVLYKRTPRAHALVDQAVSIGPQGAGRR
ncbi:winged helix-turn-helix domain-containing protein [Kibdelosporangium aridum]|uniref:winged helix-turn-helix domain-containing protein n=1 Tax=Kibdelosporangium aridum TaxID=2030 RepID=UPI000AB4A9AF